MFCPVITAADAAERSHQNNDQFHIDLWNNNGQQCMNADCCVPDNYVISTSDNLFSTKSQKCTHMEAVIYHLAGVIIYLFTSSDYRNMQISLYVVAGSVTLIYLSVCKCKSTTWVTWCTPSRAKKISHMQSAIHQRASDPLIWDKRSEASSLGLWWAQHLPPLNSPPCNSC